MTATGASSSAAVQPPAMMSGADALMQQLLADGTEHIFGNPGTTEIRFLDRLHRYPDLNFILTLHEAVAVAAADGYARATRRPAFVQLHVAPGLGNGLGMLFNAAQTRSPLVVYAGNWSTRDRAQEPILGGELVEIARPICKWAVEVPHPDDIPRLVRRAMKIAAEPPQGPVLLSIPINVLADEGTVQIAPTTFTRTAGAPRADDLKALIRLLVDGERVAIVVGDGLIPAAPCAAVTQLAELLGAPIMSGGWSSEPVLDPAHPQWAGYFHNGPPTAARAAYLAADVVLHLGAPATPPPFDRRSAGERDVRVLQVDLDMSHLSKNEPADLTIAADPAATAEALVERLLREPLPDGWRAQRRAVADDLARALKGDLAAVDAAAAADRDQMPIAGSRLAGALDAVLPKDAVVFDESLSIRSEIARRLARGPGSYFRARGSGIGSGMAAALGVQLARPDRPVVGVVADGSSIYSISALWTAAHHGIPVTWVIANNRSYRTLKSNGLAYLDVDAAASIPGTDLDQPPIAFDQLAQSFGVQGWRVERPEDLDDVLAEAVEQQAPTLVEVVTDGNFP
jgi:benzoylformate decarboxylase